MGSNVYLENIKTYGYQTESASTQIDVDIDPIDGKRVAIRSFGMTCGATATTVTFMQALGETTTTAAVASNATTGFIGTAEFQTSDNAIATGDYIAIELDDGTYQYTTVATGSYDDFSISAALTDTVAAGNKVWGFGLYSDSQATGGHIRYYLTASTSHTEDLDGGIFYGAAKGYPMKAWHANDAAAAGSVDWITVEYINK